MDLNNVNNYNLLEQKNIKDINSDVYYFEHNKTKAKVIVIKNDDNNKTFGIGFRTPPVDNTGMPHIIEHSVLCGSKKYPTKDPFVELMKSSLNTFLNALTFPDKTIYPVSSCNHKDFKNLMDVYLDAVFFPNMYNRKQIFMQEGWHYELSNKEDELMINGVVYNEMKGAFSSPDQVLGREILHSLFPDNCYGVESGGDPDYIPELTYEKFLDFHSKYYHPSNSYIFLYGDGNWEEILNYIDSEYLCKFDYKEIDSKIKNHKPLLGEKLSHIEFPISENESIDDKAMTSISYPLCAVDDILTLTAINIVSYILFDSPGAMIKQSLIDEGFAKNVLTENNNDLLNPFYSIILKGADLSKEKEIKPFIDKMINKLLENGLDKKQLQATINAMEFKYREADYQGLSKGLVYYMNMLTTWLYDLNPFIKLELSDVYNQLKGLVNENYFEDIIRKYFVDAEGYLITSVEPSQELGKVKEEKLKKSLQELKNSLSEEQIDTIIKETKELKEYQETPSTQEELDTIPVLTRNDLECKVKDIKNEEIIQDDVKILHHAYQTNGIGYLNILFNITNIDEELLPYLNILRRLFANVNTTNHTYQELDIEKNLYTGGIDFSIEDLFNSFDDSNLYFICSGSVLYNNINHALEIIKEIITSSSFEDKKLIKEKLTQMKLSFDNIMVSSGHLFSFRRGLSYISKGDRINDEINGISFYQTIAEILGDFDNRFDDLRMKLERLVKIIFRQDNILISYNCEQEGLSQLLECVKTFKESLNKEKIVLNAEYQKPVLLNEGFKTSSNVQYVSRTGNFKKHGFEYVGSYLVLKNILNTEYLWIQGRVLGGAYGCMAYITRTGSVVFTSYRDPHIKNTNNIYENVVKFIDDFNADEKQMTKYIIGAIGELIMPTTPSVDGKSALQYYLRNITKESVEKIINEVINCSFEDIKNAKSMIEAILSDNALCVIGNEKKIESDKDLFMNIENLVK